MHGWGFGPRSPSRWPRRQERSGAAGTPSSAASTSSIRSELASLPAYDVPNPDPTAPPGSAFFLTGLGWVKWVGIIVFVGGLMVLGVQVAVSDGHRVEWGSRGGRFLGGMVVFGAASAIVGIFL